MGARLWFRPKNLHSWSVGVTSLAFLLQIAYWVPTQLRHRKSNPNRKLNFYWGPALFSNNGKGRCTGFVYSEVWVSRIIFKHCTGVEITQISDLSFGQVDLPKKIYLSNKFSTCPPLKFCCTDNYFAGAIMFWIDGNISFGQPPLQFYLSDTIFTCPGQADSL